MKLIRYSKSSFNKTIGVAAIGNFDGVHLGHQHLLKQVIERAKTLRLPASVIIFEPQPLEFFRPDAAPARLTKLREKIELFRQMKIDNVVVLHFNKEIANLSANEFVSSILVQRYQIKELIVGDDFRFGANRQGDFALLETLSNQYNFSLSQTQSFLIQGQRVSSSLIRETLQKNDLTQAEVLLGRPYSLSGRVVHGNKLGRELGFPTANILLKRIKSPVLGIYVVRMLGLDRPVYGVANIGSRPTVDQSTRVLLEVYLFDFNRNIYGEHVTVEVLHKLRDEEKYESLELLKKQIAKDVQKGYNLVLKNIK